jgi:hypothetical protein
MIRKNDLVRAERSTFEDSMSPKDCSVTIHFVKSIQGPVTGFQLTMG